MKQAGKKLITSSSLNILKEKEFVFVDSAEQILESLREKRGKKGEKFKTNINKF